MSDDNPPADHVVVEEDDLGSKIEEHVKSKPTWMRLIFMVVFYVLGGFAAMVGSVVILLGFLWVLFTGETNPQLKQVGQGIASYIYEIIRYLSYNSDVKPFPFEADWPAPGSDD